MRKVLAIVVALSGGYLVWWAIKLVRVLLIVADKSMDATMLTFSGGMALVGAALLALGWWLFRDRGALPPPVQ